MGVVQRQSLKNSIINYLGIIVGGLSTLFVYPLDWDLYGNIQFSLSAAILFSTFFSLGSHSLVNKFFPYFQKNGIKGFLSLVFIYSMINIALVSLILVLFKAPFYDLLELIGFNIDQINRNLFIIFPIGILLVFITIMRVQSYNYERIVYPDLISNFTVKLVAPSIVLLSYFAVINYQGAGWILVLYHLFLVFALMYYVKTLGGLDFKSGVLRRVSKSKHVEMIRYMLYGAMNHIGNVLVYKIDIVMIGLLLTAVDVGYYSVFLFLTVVIEIPTNAVQRITTPLISKATDENNWQEIEKIYKNASVNLSIIGIALFGLLWMNMSVFFAVMTRGEDLIIFKMVFLYLALTRIFEMVTSVNYNIIAFSKYFRVNTLFILLLATLNIGLNYWLIGEIHLYGAALASAISMFVYNVLKTSFVWAKYKIHPFRWEYLILLVFLLIAVFAPIFIPSIFDSVPWSILASGIFVILFTGIVYKMKLSPEINTFMEKYLPIGK